MSTTKQVQIVNPKEFIITVLDVDNKIFVMHGVIREWEEISMQSKKQIQFRALIFDKAPIEVLAEYSDYSDIFLTENTAELPENTGMNEHTIKLEEGKLLLFEPIYSLGHIELETLKTYIKTNIINGFIWSSNLLRVHLFYLIGSQIKVSAFV